MMGGEITCDRPRRAGMVQKLTRCLATGRQESRPLMTSMLLQQGLVGLRQMLGAMLPVLRARRRFLARCQ